MTPTPAHLERARRLYYCGKPGFTIVGVATLIAETETAVWNAALEKAADIHPNIRVTCDHEEANGSPGCACMGAVINYRDSIRELRRALEVEE